MGSPCILLVSLLLLYFTGSDCTVQGEIYGKEKAGASRVDLGQENTTPSGQPQFDPSVLRNVTGHTGESIYLICRVHNLGNNTVAWIRHRDLHILTVGLYTYASEDRFQPVHLKEFDEWRLHIRDIQPNDRGTYECQVSTQPIISYVVNFNVKESGEQFRRSKHIPHDEIYQTMYSDQVPTAAILGAPEIHVGEGDTINLTCTIRYSHQAPSYIAWYRDNKILGYDESQYRARVLDYLDENPRSYLLISGARVSDSGKYTCVSSNAEETYARVYVTLRENPAEMYVSSAAGFPRATRTYLSVIILTYILN